MPPVNLPGSSREHLRPGKGGTKDRKNRRVFWKYFKELDYVDESKSKVKWANCNSCGGRVRGQSSTLAHHLANCKSSCEEAQKAGKEFKVRQKQGKEFKQKEKSGELKRDMIPGDEGSEVKRRKVGAQDNGVTKETENELGALSKVNSDVLSGLYELLRDLPGDVQKEILRTVKEKTRHVDFLEKRLGSIYEKARSLKKELSAVRKIRACLEKGFIPNERKIKLENLREELDAAKEIAPFLANFLKRVVKVEKGEADLTKKLSATLNDAKSISNIVVEKEKENYPRSENQNNVQVRDSRAETPGTSADHSSLESRVSLSLSEFVRELEGGLDDAGDESGFDFGSVDDDLTPLFVNFRDPK